MTPVWPINGTHPDPAIIARAAALLRAGKLVAFPTETVYGLGANALDETAVRSIFTAKGRPATNPVIVHVADVSEVHRVATSWPETAAKLASAFWPGPLTLVLPASADVPKVVTACGPTVAVRVPNHPVALALLRAAGVPIAAPSANLSTQLSPTRAQHVVDGLNGRIDAILDGGPCPGGIESTVVDVSGNGVRLLRPGLITVPMLELVVGRVVVSTGHIDESRPMPSPGMMARHYAPRTSLVLVASNEAALEYEATHKRTRRWVLPDDPLTAAASLYDGLHQLDDLGLDVIVIVLPGTADDHAWTAVRDRLTRAATEPTP